MIFLVLDKILKNNKFAKEEKTMGKYLKGMVWGSAIGITAAAVAITAMEPRVGRVISRKSKQAARQMKKKFSQMM